MGIQEIRGRIGDRLEQYYKYFVHETHGDYMTAIHQDREMAHEILTELYNLICAISGLDNSNAKGGLTMVDGKMIQMAVIYEYDGYADGCPVYDVARCPTCDYEFEEGREPWGRKYCPECGQRLKWED